MFESENVSVFLQQLKFTFDDDEIVAHGTFYITPISHSLAYEVDPKLAEDLFRKRGIEYVPRAEVPAMNFDLKLPAQSMTYAVHQDIPSGRGLIPHVAIAKIRAFRLFAESNDYTLAFDCQFPCNDKEMVWQMLNRGKKPLLVTFRPLQADLDFPKPEPLCEICSNPAVYRTKPGKSLACAEHIAAYVGEEAEPLDPDFDAKAQEAAKGKVDAVKTEGKGKRKGKQKELPLEPAAGTRKKKAGKKGKK